MENTEETVVPVPCRLPESIQWLQELENLLLVLGKCYARRLFHMDNLSLLKFGIQVSIFYINLVYFVVPTSAVGQCQSAGGHFRNGCVCIKEVDARYLRETLHNEAGLVVDNCYKRYGLLHYAYLIRRTGPVIFLSRYLI